METKCEHTRRDKHRDGHNNICTYEGDDPRRAKRKRRKRQRQRKGKKERESRRFYNDQLLHRIPSFTDGTFSQNNLDTE